MTYSIVARDQSTGEFGVAVQSHWFSVGSVVPWARPGVGAVATQANALAEHGPRVLESMQAGASAAEALAKSLDSDPLARTRQVAAVDRAGGVACHTGEECIPFSGDVQGDGVCCQANIMSRETVWQAMLTAYTGATGPLSERLMAALEAAEDEGGDIRGKQSAAILVVPAEGAWWQTSVSLRVEDHEAPLAEMRRLLDLHSAYELAEQAEAISEPAGRADAANLFAKASTLIAANHELLFWAGLGKVESGDTDAGIKQIRQAISMHPAWAELLPRIPASVAPAAPTVVELLKLA